jgi:hypothetical protein
MNNCNCLNTCDFKIDYCNYPIFCDDYDCSNPETCVQMIPSDCVIYEGTLFEQYGLQSGVTVTEIIQRLVDLIYPNCNTSTTTSTTTVLPQCTSYHVANVNSPTPVEITYINCSNVRVNPTPLNQGQSINICAIQGSLYTINGVVTNNGICD